jgi:hypothetical protein
MSNLNVVPHDGFLGAPLEGEADAETMRTKPAFDVASVVDLVKFQRVEWLLMISIKLLQEHILDVITRPQAGFFHVPVFKVSESLLSLVHLELVSLRGRSQDSLTTSLSHLRAALHSLTLKVHWHFSILYLITLDFLSEDLKQKFSSIKVVVLNLASLRRPHRTRLNRLIIILDV